MESNLLHTLNKQLVELDRLNGASALAEDVAKAIDLTVEEYFGDRSREALLREVVKLYHTFLSCRPRMPHIISDLQKLAFYLYQNKDADTETLKRLIKTILIENEKRVDLIVSHATTLFHEKKTLLLHTLSMPIKGLLEQIAENRDNGDSATVVPDVYIADQSKSKSGQIIKLFDHLQLPFFVVSEFALAHVISKLNIAFFGGLTFNVRNEVILAPGSTSLISQLRMAQVPVYLCMGTNKFSFWDEETELAFHERRNKSLEHIEYAKEVFSHDVVEVDLFTRIITESGLLTPSELRRTFAEKQLEFYNHEREIEKIATDDVALSNVSRT